MSQETEAIKETAKAAQEIAKASGKAVDAGSNFGRFISRYISGSLEQGIGIFEDKLKYMRWERQQRLMVRADQFMQEIGIESPTRAIPLKLAIPLFQGASLEDNDDLQDIWAKLLVNAANKNSGIDLKRVYIDILERITPLEAQILSAIYILPFAEIQHKGVFTADLPDKAVPADEKKPPGATEPSEEIKLALASLSAIDCLSPTKTYGGGEAFAWVNPTFLGKSSVNACTLKI
ncbi:MAG: DUF4393 domain-containing protein [Desulfobacteraceae bacterium]|nr:DUF4393 domain-containing protein [Desulfobacteraceae bacterium]